MALSCGPRHGPEEGVAAEPTKLTVLVAEDEPVVRALVGEVLQRHGYHVLKAEDGVEALEVAAQHPGPIHLLLTDLTMPRLNGHDLHRRLSDQRPETRTLFMSARLDNGLDLSAAFLPKPFVAQELVRKVRDVLGSPGFQP